MINELLNIDCMEYMKTCKDKQFDLAIVDPPYGIGMAREFSIDTKNGVRARPKLEAKDWDDTKPKQEYFDDLFRVSKNQIIWGGNYFIDFLYNTSNIIIWDKCNHLETFADAEIAWCSIKKPCKIFKYDNKGWNTKETSKIHPTQKPVALYKWLLSRYAHAGDRLLDTHSGSGSFRIAAYDMGFDLVSCELDADYCKANEARYQAHIAQQELIPIQEIQQLTFGGGIKNDKRIDTM